MKRLTVIAAALIALATLSLTSAIQPAPDDPQYPQQWTIDNMRVREAWDWENGTWGSGAIVVAVVDTGVDGFVTEPDFTGRLLPGWNTLTNTTDARDDTTSSFGTAAAGIIAAIPNNGNAVAGINANVRILPVKVCNAFGSCAALDVAEGITWAVDNGAHVITTAVSFPSSTPELTAAVAYAVDRNVNVVAHSGSSSGSTVLFPAALPGVFTVAPHDVFNTQPGYANSGPQMDVSAPGVLIRSLTSGGCCSDRTDPSLAAAHVAGVIALLRSGGLGQWQAENAIREGAIDAGAIGFDQDFGYGRVDAQRASIKAFDGDSDCDVDLLDVNIALAHFGELGVIDQPYDVNGDGSADLPDVLFVLSAFGRQC